MTAIEGAEKSFEDLSAGEVWQGFKTAAIYISDTERAMGGRFLHERTGFLIDLLQIQSVPQAFIWVNTFPTSDMGEPHTQEHLLLGKGNKGRRVASLEDMSLASSSAFTMQWRTCYHFHTAAGAGTFYQLLESQLDALLNPDYTDEEIRREVRNFGVTENPADGTLRLEEKGSVYNEMVSTFSRPWSRLHHSMQIALYGPEHPLSYSSGGLPAAIREMKPEHIRRFHADNYQLGNMGLVGSFPKEMPPGVILREADAILCRLAKESRPAIQRDYREALRDPLHALPTPQAFQPGCIELVDYPHRNDQQPGPVVFAWPATLSLPSVDRLLLEFFIENLSGDATTNLYKRFVDSKTREIDVGAQGVFGWVSSDQGHPVYLGLHNVAAEHLTEAKLEMLRERVADEIRRVANWTEHDPALAEFNMRLRSRLVESRRDTSKFVNSPPSFGFRHCGSSWMMHLERIVRTDQLRKSLLMKPDLDEIERRLDAPGNLWREMITARWQLLATVPYAGAARARPELLASEDAEREARIKSESERLQRHYQTATQQQAIERYRADYDAASAELDRLAKESLNVRFVDSPPLTLDDQLDYRVYALANGIEMVASTFDNMTSATLGVALRLDGVRDEELVYLSLLPSLLTNVGVLVNGEAISYEQMSEMLRREILGLSAYFTTNTRTGRCELVVRGSGNDLAEAVQAAEWMRRVLAAPDWRPENLARLRDLIDQILSGLRNVTQGAEENWVHNPSTAYRRQENRLLIAVDSFFTRAHQAQRLRWLLKDAGDGYRAAAEFLTELADAPARLTEAATRETELKHLLGALRDADDASGEKLAPALVHYRELFSMLPGEAQTVAREAAKDLEQLFADVPEETLSEDWRYLCLQMRADLGVDVSNALAALDSLRARLLAAGSARMFMIGSRASQAGLEGAIAALTTGWAAHANEKVARDRTPLVKARLRARRAEATDPIFVGLVNPNTQGGVFLHSAPGTSYFDTDRDALLAFLAAKLYSGGGAHGIFMKTWGAGLAYSNGLNCSPATGLITYYAERTPELPQTLKFVIAELKRSERDDGLVEYAIAQVFGDFRSASGYESRGEAMAADLADGYTPAVVSRFRRAILELRASPRLADELYARRHDVYARVLPGYDEKAVSYPGALYYVIAPEKQLEIYEEYLKSVAGESARLYRLYPRDYWLTLALDAGGQ